MTEEQVERVEPAPEAILDAVGEVLLAALYLLEDSEDDGSDLITTPKAGAQRLDRALTVFEDWPDEPGYTCGPAANAQWALRNLFLATQPTPQERREWNPSDGDRICQKCGTDNPVWFAPSPIWNCLMGGPDATDDPGGVLCPTCFMALDDDQIWEVRPKAQPTPQEAAMKLALKALDEAHSECRDYADTHPFIKQLDEAREALRAIAGEDKA